MGLVVFTSQLAVLTASGFYPMVRSRLCHWLIGFSWGLGNPTKKIGSKCRIPGNPGFLGVWAKEFNKKTVIQMLIDGLSRVEQHFPEFGSFKGRFFFRRDPWNFTNLKHGSPKENPSEKKNMKFGVLQIQHNVFQWYRCTFLLRFASKTCHDPPTISSSTAIGLLLV